MTSRSNVGEWLLFDTFGTLLDWHGSIVRRIGDAAPGVMTPEAASEFAKHWAHGYGDGTKAVVDGEKPFRPLTEILRRAFDDAASAFACPFTNMQKETIAVAWEYLTPWYDVRAGMLRLSTQYALAAFTNADRQMLIRIAHNAHLPFNVLFSAELAQAYKPDPRMYEAAIRFIGGEPSRMTLVASHTFDLNAAADAGMKTALVSRPQEPGGDPTDMRHPLDWWAADLEDLADQMIRRAS